MEQGEGRMKNSSCLNIKNVACGQMKLVQNVWCPKGDNELINKNRKASSHACTHTFLHTHTHSYTHARAHTHKWDHRT